MKVLKNCFEKIETLLHAISWIAIFVMMLLITLDTAGRYLLNKPIQGTYEISEIILMVMVVFLTLSYSFKTGDHVRIDFLYRHFSKKTKAAVDLFGLILSAALFSIITYQGWLLTYEAWINSETTFGVITVPTYLSYIWVPLGSGALTIRLIIDGIKEIGKLFGRNSEEITGKVEVMETVKNKEELASSHY